uniref:Uncharacterized protein n=1 Tax=Emiliania huxleyi TaxID=2903 RepID=A0A7S3RQZ1_EMIHU
MPPVSPVVAAKPAMPPPSMTYVDGKRRAALGKAQQQPPTSLSCCERCFCVKAEDRSNIASWMLKDTRDKTPPSACGKLLCFCDEAYPRTPNCIEEIPEIRALAGTVLEDGQALSGTVFTLRWMEFDKATRSGVSKTFGGYGGKYSAAQWSLGSSWTTYVGAWCDRCVNQSYGWQFSEDWRSAKITVKMNWIVCFPWLPPWFTVCDCCIIFDMVQARAQRPSHRSHIVTGLSHMVDMETQVLPHIDPPLRTPCTHTLTP